MFSLSHKSNQTVKKKTQKEIKNNFEAMISGQKSFFSQKQLIDYFCSITGFVFCFVKQLRKGSQNNSNNNNQTLTRFILSSFLTFHSTFAVKLSRVIRNVICCMTPFANFANFC